MMNLDKFLWGGLGGKLFGNKKAKNPADAAKPWLDKAGQLYDPYMQQGQQAGNQLNAQFGAQAQDPNAYYNNIANQYQQSAGFEGKKRDLLSDAENTAAAGGFVGGPAHQKGALGLVDSLMNQDFQSWYNNVMGIQKSGQEGQQHFADQGFEAANNQANLFGQQAQYGAQGQEWKNKQKQDQINQLMRLLATGGGAVAGGLAGGPVGAAQGAAIGSKFF